MNKIIQLKRLITKLTGATATIKENIFDFTYKSNKENTICLINPKIRQIIKTERILTEKNIKYTLQGNQDTNGNICYYFIIN